jgi:hypothetical protein
VLEDAIDSHICSLEANMCVTDDIPLGCSLLLTVTTVNSIQTLKAVKPRPRNAVDALRYLERGADEAATVLANLEIQTVDPTSIYYHREQLITSLEGLRIDLITVSSILHIDPSKRREPRGNDPALFPNKNVPRARAFGPEKFTYFLSSRVWCTFLDRNPHSRMPLVPTPARFKLLHACGQWHSSRVFTHFTGCH